MTFSKNPTSILTLGFLIIWRNSNTKRYLRIRLNLGTWYFEHDFLRKELY